MSSISFIVPTIGRASLAETLASIHTQEGDEIIVVGKAPESFALESSERLRYLPCASGRDWGCKERTIGIEAARGDYLAFMDDDDTYEPNARYVMAAAIDAMPSQPSLFRVEYPNGYQLWRHPLLQCGNVSTQMILIPNDPARLGKWTKRREGDYDFLASMAWPAEDIAWWPIVIARMGHDDG